MQNPSGQFEASYHSYNRMTVFEGLSVKLKPAPLLKRILAYVIDFSIVTLVLYIFFYLFFFIFFMGLFSIGVLNLKNMADVVSFLLIIFFLLLVVTIYDGYFVFFEYKKGATLGKKIFGLRVVPTNKAKLTLGQCIFRDLFRLIDCILILPGLISIAITKNHQRLGDLIAGTMVTYSPRKEVENQFMYLNAEQYHLFYETLKPLPVSTEHANAFLQFAFAIFISGKSQTPSPELISHWENFILYYVPEAKKHGLDTTTLFIFFAEYCLQSSKQKS